MRPSDSRVAICLSCLASVLWAAITPASAIAKDAPARSDPASEALAVEAQQVLSRYCAEAAGREYTRAAESVAAVSDVWARVSGQLEVSKKVYLLYWRGVLGQCLSQEEKALEDLQTFVRAREGSELWAGLVVDAQRRVRRLQDKSPLPTGPKPGVVLGIALGVGAAALAVGAGLSWAQSQQAAQSIYPDDLQGTQLQDALAEGAQNAGLSTALAVSSIACGVGAAVSLVLAIKLPANRRLAAKQPPVLVAGPSSVGLFWETTW